MAEPRSRRDVCLEYSFDRLLVSKLEQVYQILVPDRVRIVGNGSKLIGAGLKTAAIYARGILVHAEGGDTIASQTAALVAFSAEQGYAVPANGYSRTKAIVA